MVPDRIPGGTGENGLSGLLNRSLGNLDRRREPHRYPAQLVPVRPECPQSLVDLRELTWFAPTIRPL